MTEGTTSGAVHRHGDRLHTHEHDHAGHHHDHDHQHGNSELAAAHLWSLDNVVLTTIGIDVGSSTSHFMLGRVHLRREASTAASRFEVVSREIVWRSPVRLTPYRDDGTIDAGELADFLATGYRDAGIAAADIDAGAVILTGEALKRRNARALAEAFAAEAGTFVCASAGHHMEAVLAAHGSGAAARSLGTSEALLNVDMGGGTTKLALVSGGDVTATVAVAVGARLIVTDAAGRIVRLETPAVELASALGIELRPGDVLAAADRARIVDRMVGVVAGLVARRGPDELTRALLVTESWDAAAAAAPVDALTLSGGVAEFFYSREAGDFGDLGRDLAAGLRAAFAAAALPVREPEQGIRATVVGASQFTVQLSGNTILISAPQRLPLRNVPVVRPAFALGAEIDAGAVAEQVRRALSRSDHDDALPVAVAFAWSGPPSYARVSAVARGIASALAPRVAAGAPILLAIDGDVALTMGRILRDEVVPGTDVIAIDGLRLQDLDYVDLGTVHEPAGVVPVTIKSLLF